MRSVVQPQMIVYEIRADIETIEKNAALSQEAHFDLRAEAIDYIEFNIIDRIEGLLEAINPPPELIALKEYAERVRRQLEAVDDVLFQRLRADIRQGRYTGTALRSLIAEYVGPVSSGRRRQDEVGYDSLDEFINSLLHVRAAPPETKSLELEMVSYHQTPARIIFELVEKAQFTAEDVFYDLGSGLGQVPILVNLLGGAAARGIEFEPAYCDDARVRAADLNLSQVAFINADARAVEYAEGNIFFMYTPFEGSILQEVLEKLRTEAQRRKLRLFTYGPCTPQVSRQNWLTCVDPNGVHVYKLGVFTTL